ncbi:MAG: hypothetical protein M3Z87_00120 [Lactobacillus sp.]|nr:hypothetical protein [Lactobacillus sp.]
MADEIVNQRIRLYQSDVQALDRLKKENPKLKSRADVFHFLLGIYKNWSVTNDNQKSFDILNQKLNNVSIEVSTLSEFFSDFAYLQIYHDGVNRIDIGTDAPAYANAKKRALEKIKNNQERKASHTGQKYSRQKL